MNWLNIFEGIMAPVTTWIEGWNKRTNAKVEAEIKLSQASTDAKIERMRVQQAGDIAWENLQISNAGWKDEYWTLVLSLPMIMCFFPGLVEYVSDGFKALETTPEWYRYCIGIAIGAAFGVRMAINGIGDFMRLRKGV